MKLWVTVGSTISTSSTSPPEMVRRGWLKRQGTPHLPMCGSVYATPVALTFGSGSVQVLTVTWTGHQDKDLKGNMTVAPQVPLRPQGGSSGSACLRQKSWISSVFHVLDESWGLVTLQMTESFEMCAGLYKLYCFRMIFFCRDWLLLITITSGFTRDIMADFNTHLWRHLSTFVEIQLPPLLCKSEFHYMKKKPSCGACRRAHSQSWAARVMWEHWSVLCLSLRGYYLHVDPMGWAPRLSFLDHQSMAPDPDCLLPSLTWPSLAVTWKSERTDAHLPVCTLEVHGASLTMGTGNDTYSWKIVFHWS